MESYHVLELECDRDLKLSDIAYYIANHLSYNRRLFEIGNIDISSIYSKQITAIIDAYGLDRFTYEYRLRENYDPTPIMSNLDAKTWLWGNPTYHENLSADAFAGVIEVCQRLKSTMCREYMIGFDEISWDGATAPEGTFGYEMPKATIFQGDRYLSNSVIITKDYVGKPNLIAYVSFESKYKELECIKQLIDFLGKIKREKELFAPSDDDEREEWDRVISDMRKKSEVFESLRTSLLSELPYEVIEPPRDPFRVEPYPKERINIRKLEKELLCFDGWELKKKDPHFRSTVTSKTIDGVEYKMWIDTLHGGHYLQLWFSCSSPMFELSVHSAYCSNITDEVQAVNFMKNAAYLRDKYVEIMTKLYKTGDGSMS